MFFGPQTLPLDLADKNTRIHIELMRYEIKAIDNFDKDIQFQYRKNIVLTYYNYNDAEGNWGTVDEHYVATTDLENIATGFQDLLLQKTDLFEYETVIDDMGNPFMIHFSRKKYSTGKIHRKCQRRIPFLESSVFRRVFLYSPINV